MPSTPQTGQVFRATTDVIPIDVYPRDAKGQFIPDLNENDFQIFEDGVEQKVLNFTRANGGQFYNDFASTAPLPVTEGLVLPKSTPKADTASRIFIIFIDDLHFMAGQTPEVRKLLQLIRDTVIHENDLVGFVSSGHSSIEVDPTYDYQHRRFNEVIDKVVGSGPTIDEMIQMEPSQDGLAELNYNIGAAFQAAHNLLSQMEDLHGKRKSFIWISNGYILDPFKDSRLMSEMQRYADVGACDNVGQGAGQTDASTLDRMNPCRYINSDISEVQNVRVSETAYGMDIFGQSTMQWKQSDLMSMMAELIRSAQRANTMFFTLDPRGLISGFNTASRSQALSNQEETDFILQTTGTLRALAENTGGLSCVNRNDCRPVLQQIDNMTSDYYMLGYRSSNPDPFKLARKIEIKVKRPNVVLVAGRDYRDTYYLKRPSKPPKK